MANEAVGEKNVTLGGRQFLLRPSFRAIVEIENKTGKSVLELFNAFKGQRVSASETVAILSATIKAGGGSDIPSDDDLGDLIFSEGILNVQAIAVEVLLSALVKGQEGIEKKTEPPTNQ